MADDPVQQEIEALNSKIQHSQEMVAKYQRLAREWEARLHRQEAKRARLRLRVRER